MRFLRGLAKVLGWLLTPLVAWAASFLGAWLGSGIGTTLESANAALLTAVAGAVVFAVLALAIWIRLLRHSPELRHALEVTEEGVPTAVAELGSKEEPK